jgi:vacuolar-type H+-ATPase catalytic subunit A/Vma1
MMKCIIGFHDCAQKVILESPVDHKVSFQIIMNQLSKEHYQLTRMKFQNPKQSKDELENFFRTLKNSIETQFKNFNK